MTTVPSTSAPTVPARRPRAAAVVEALRRRVVGLVDRAAALKDYFERRDELVVAERRRQEELAAARRDFEEWERPKRRLAELEKQHGDAGLAASRDLQALEERLRAEPPAAVRRLAKDVERIREQVNAQKLWPGGLEAVGAALVSASTWCRDDGWKLEDEEAERLAVEHRRAIEAAIQASREADMLTRLTPAERQAWWGAGA